MKVLSFPVPMGEHAAAYNELLLADGQPRPHQQRLFTFLSQLSPAELAKLQGAVLSRINEQEVTFNILGVPEGTNRPWLLDPLPLVFSFDEWEQLSSGLGQRARVLSAALEDLLGPQRLLHEGIIPPSLVFGHPGFLRASHGWTPRGGHRLHLYAADFGRDAEGRFLVYSDRTAAPAGSGYALENRLVLGRTLATLFQEYGVERLRQFFDLTREVLLSLGGGAEQPRVVVLTPGSQDESSFEHAYLARYLGFELVEGRDLTVREQTVFLKTLSGLQRVDVILRRIYDQYCDPVELRPDSWRGVPGLVSAARAGNVALANPLGAGFLEAPAFKAYLPKVARALLGEVLTLPSIPTYWCGDRQSLRYVRDHLDRLVLRPAFSDRHGEPFRPALMSQAERAAFVARLESSPAQFIAEEWSRLSIVPVGSSRGLAYADVSVRTFLCRKDDDYVTMPGGLARVNASPDGLFLSARGDSKDVWIPSAQQVPDHKLPTMPDLRVALRRGGLDLPSRLLDDIFWLGRHVERCDMIARLTRAGLERLDNELSDEAPVVLHAILDTLRGLQAIPSSTAPSLDAAQVLLLGAATDDENPESLTSAFRRVHALTLSVRSRLSRDAWHVLRRITTSSESPKSKNPGAVIEWLDDVLVALSAFVGITLDNMVRGHVWMFLDMGRRAERGNLTLTLVRHMLPPGAVRLHMEALLEIADSLLTYRARYLSSLQVAPVVDLLLTDETNPRSLAFQVRALRDHVLRLPRLDDVVRSRAERRIIALESTLLTVDVPQVCGADGGGLRQLLEDASDLLWQFSDDVTQTWFSHARDPMALSPPSWVDEELEAP